MLLGENILTLSLYLYRKKTYSSNLLLLKYDTDMKREPIYIRIYHFYLEGFREMKLGKTLWLIILVKLFKIGRASCRERVYIIECEMCFVIRRFTDSTRDR